MGEVSSNAVRLLTVTAGTAHSVDYLGMPVAAMPLYASSRKWSNFLTGCENPPASNYSGNRAMKPGPSAKMIQNDELDAAGMASNRLKLKALDDNP